MYDVDASLQSYVPWLAPKREMCGVVSEPSKWAYLAVS